MYQPLTALPRDYTFSARTKWTLFSWQAQIIAKKVCCAHDDGLLVGLKLNHIQFFISSFTRAWVYVNVRNLRAYIRDGRRIYSTAIIHLGQTDLATTQQ